MTARQLLTLTIGPSLLVAMAYAVAAPARNNIAADLSTLASIPSPADSSGTLEARCEQTARRLRRQLPLDWSIRVAVPFVLAGDDDEEVLDEYYMRAIQPAQRALRATYFDQPVSHPISVLLCSSDEQFRECSLRLESREYPEYAGLYSRPQRRIIVNRSTGDGTLTHELTHALAHADFPDLPEWLDEGLAALHEEFVISADGQRLHGLDNWRREIAVEALNHGELRLLADVTSHRFGTRERARVDYAYVRSFCLYLQELGQLEPFYRQFRAQQAQDPTGLRTLCAVTHSDPRSLDDAFRRWLIEPRPTLSRLNGSSQTGI